jgi:hypothetical protein
LLIGVTGLSKGSDSSGSVVTEVGSVAVVIVADVFVTIVSFSTEEVCTVILETHSSKPGCLSLGLIVLLTVGEGEYDLLYLLALDPFPEGSPPAIKDGLLDTEGFPLGIDDG